MILVRRRPLLLALLWLVTLAVGAALVLVPTADVNGATFTVTSTGDGADSDIFDGACDDGTEACTLRAAIAQANAVPGLDTIDFNIGGGGLQFILPGNPLAEIAEPVSIDGFSQPGSSAGAPKIVLYGNSAGSTADGLVISSGDSTVRGLVISGFAGSGIRIMNNGGNTLQGNFIGTNFIGNSALPNGTGIYISNTPDNVIGGENGGDRNVISGNREGVVIFDTTDGNSASRNRILGNFIGTNSAGNAAVGNSNGIQIYSSNNTIGGTEAAARNVISGNNFGVEISLTGNRVEGNLIGANLDGTASIANGTGVSIWNGWDDVIGGSAPAPGTLSLGTAPASIFRAELATASRAISSERQPLARLR